MKACWQISLAIRLGIDIQDEKLCVIGCSGCPEWGGCPLKQIIPIDSGYYHIAMQENLIQELGRADRLIFVCIQNKWIPCRI